jgi:hypothetical protein
LSIKANNTRKATMITIMSGHDFLAQKAGEDALAALKKAAAEGPKGHIAQPTAEEIKASTARRDERRMADAIKKAEKKAKRKRRAKRAASERGEY